MTMDMHMKNKQLHASLMVETMFVSFSEDMFANIESSCNYSRNWSAVVYDGLSGQGWNRPESV